MAALAAIVNGYSITVRQEGSPYSLTDVALVRWFFREVSDALREMDRAQQEGSTIVSDRQTVAQYPEDQLTNTRKSAIRQKTNATYACLNRSHLVPGLGRTVLLRLTSQYIQEFLHAKLDAGLSTRTVCHCSVVLRTALEQAMRWGPLGRNVAKLVRPSRAKRTDVQPLNPDQARTLLQSVQGHRLEAFFTDALTIGLRPGEALGLRRQDVDLDAGTLSVRRTLQHINSKLQFEEVKSATGRRS
ncbi:MAG TPA: hypothetical protein VFW17_07920 [Ktedonobacterales bacterium]|nr:hypothetical protein [Ktedonobacterales bacterium]